MHKLRRADDGVDRTSLNAERAADAARFIDNRDLPWLVDAASLVQRKIRPCGQASDFPDDVVSPRRTAVDGGLSRGDGERIGLTARIAALGALRLRQHGVD